MVARVARELRAEASRTDERRVLVLAGDRDRGIDAAYDAIEAVGADDDAVSVVSTREGFRFEEHRPRGADGLLGRTRDVVVLDCHERFVPNALGRAVGAVDGGGLLVLLTPPLDEWPATRDRFDEALAVPPYDLGDVTGRFRERLAGTLRTHPGVAVVALGGSGDETVERDGQTGGSAADPSDGPPASPPPNASFPPAAYAACRTDDQARALRAFEALEAPGNALVVEADRGRGKSSAAGLAAGALALAGDDVLVTAPAFRNAAEVFARARAVIDDATDGDAPEADRDGERELHAPGGGRVRFLSPADAVEAASDADAAVVDEAAALPVRLLEGLLDAPAVAFCTTVHGYEGAGRGFAVRFRERLSDSRFAVRDVQLDEPVRYARNDPVESWASRALLLDARPAVAVAVDDASVDEATYRTLSPDELLADETLLGEAFGLLVAAHYRTEPNDLARLLDAPNLSARALTVAGRVVAVALLAREGGLDRETRRRSYEGERVRGNMVPDLLTSQLRDEAAAAPVGLRTVRIATHHALRGAGFGSRLLAAVHAEFADGDGPGVDYFSVGYGATPRLLRFWERAGYRTVHLSTGRNDASGEHSAIMLRPASAAGRDLLDRHAAAFRDRERDGLSDAHRGVDADVVRGALRACPADPRLDLTAAEWRAVVSAAVGPGAYDVAPGAFRDLALAALIGGPDGGEAPLDAHKERLLVRKVLQGRPWDAVADELGYVSAGACRRALGDAVAPLVDRHGTPFALRERRRFVDD